MFYKHKSVGCKKKILTTTTDANRLLYTHFIAFLFSYLGDLCQGVFYLTYEYESCDPFGLYKQQQQQQLQHTLTFNISLIKKRRKILTKIILQTTFNDVFKMQIIS